MIYIDLRRDGELLFSNLSSRPVSEGFKRVERLVEGYQIVLMATGSDAVLLGSGKHVKTAILMAVNIGEIINKIEKSKNSQYVILSHNLITTHSHLQDTLEGIVPEEILAVAKDHEGQLKIVEKSLKQDPAYSAEVFLDVIKRVVDLQAQIEGFKILSGGRKLDLGDHNLLKMLQNIVYPFYDDLFRGDVSVKWHVDAEDAERHKIKTNYKVLNVILHHLLTNAAKYAKPYSCIDVDYLPGKRELSFLMKSVRIEQDEASKIFELGYCGKNVPKSLAGEGVGMYMVQKAARLLNASVRIQTDYSAKIEEVNGIRYSPNKFVLQFPEGYVL